MDRPVRIALVGCGGIAKAHFRGYTEVKQAEPGIFDLAAVCDPIRESAEAMAEAASAWQDPVPAVYEDFEQMLREVEPHGCDICAPHFLQHTLGIACLEGGANVMIEKPFGITVRASQLIIAAAERTGRFAATAEQIRRGPSQRTARWAIQEAGLIGEPQMFYATWVREPSLAPKDSPGRRTWRNELIRSGGGPVMDSGAHFCDTVRYLFGDVDTVYGRVSRLNDRWTQDREGNLLVDEQEDTWIATLNFASGVTGVWSMSQALPGHQFNNVVYYGSEGAIVDPGDIFHGPRPTAELHKADGTVVPFSELIEEYKAQLSAEERQRIFPHGFAEQFTLEIYDFISAIADERPPEVDGKTGLKAKSIAEAIYESSLCNEVIRVADVESGERGEYQRPINEAWGIV